MPRPGTKKSAIARLRKIKGLSVQECTPQHINMHEALELCRQHILKSWIMTVTHNGTVYTILTL